MSRPSTTVKKLLTAMAYSREEFKNKVEEKVGGALLEYYKAALAALNRQTRWVQHWESEVDRLLHSELVVVLLHSIKGFKSRKKAADEVLQHLRASDDQYRRAAEHVVRRDYRLKKLQAPITDEVTEKFYRTVQDILDTHT
jgi:cobalamin biosynthesis protein CobD/CbiB